jgi:HNH endonuclease
MSAYVSEAVRLRVRAAAADRCGYCRSHQRYLLGVLEIEHIVPLSRGGSDDEDNLWLGCARCNRFKGPQIEARDPLTEEVHALFNPRVQRWGEHFRWDAGGAVICGLTPSGRATVVALRLNHEHSVAVRRNWIAAGWHPPEG